MKELANAYTRVIKGRYNAYMHGMTQDTLNKPLIAVNRQRR